MLISFSLENWMCFRDQVTFSMIASKERQHLKRLPRVEKFKTNFLPVAAIYGGNASGKTIFFKALRFAQNLVEDGTKPDGLIPVVPFKLDPAYATKPSLFKFELLIEEVVYEFSFSLTREFVLEEKLVLINSKSEKILYHRKNGKFTFESTLSKQERLKFVSKGTRDNQLFLTNSISQNLSNFRAVYDWFKKTLMLIEPSSKFSFEELFFAEKDPLGAFINMLLPLLDTGVARLDAESIPLESASVPEQLKLNLQKHMKEDHVISLIGHVDNEHLLVTSSEGELLAKKLITYHHSETGAEVKFDMREESDGSRRVIDLLPAFIDLARDSKKVYIVDELDRSLHTLLTRSLLEFYLSNCSRQTRSQLLFTTHDVLLMDQDLLRRDEMWVTERQPSGASSLYSFSEYKDVRYDKNVRKSYLQGRLGGTPRILLEATASNLELDSKPEQST